MRHLLVTNDYPPKVGGIQTYLWELWRRLPQDSFAVLTSPHDDAAAFDNAQHHRIERYDRFWLPPTRRVRARAIDLIDQIGAGVAVIDPAFPLGGIGAHLGIPYALVLHGAEVSVPARLPPTRRYLSSMIRGADVVISASRFAEREARALVGPGFPDTVYVPPGVDTQRFRPMSAPDRAAARRRLGLSVDAPLVVGVSRLVPRKGFDTLIAAASQIEHRHPGLQVVIAGTGRDESRLRGLIGKTGAPVRLLGYVPDADLADLYGCADVFAMLCRSRWAGLEQEGFGIVFVEAAAAGCPQVAGASGGAADAVADGSTGIVVANPGDAGEAAVALDRVLSDDSLRESMRDSSRTHAVERYAYDLLAERLWTALGAMGTG